MWAAWWADASTRLVGGDVANASPLGTRPWWRCCCCPRSKIARPGDINSGAACVTWKSRCLVSLVCVSFRRTTVNIIRPTLPRPAWEVRSALECIIRSVSVSTWCAYYIEPVSVERDSPYVSLRQRPPPLSPSSLVPATFPPGACWGFLGPACFGYLCVPSGFSRVPYAEPMSPYPRVGWARCFSEPLPEGAGVLLTSERRRSNEDKARERARSASA